MFIAEHQSETPQNPSSRSPKAAMDQMPTLVKTQLDYISCFWNPLTSQLPQLPMYAYSISPVPPTSCDLVNLSSFSQSKEYHQNKHPYSLSSAYREKENKLTSGLSRRSILHNSDSAAHGFLGLPGHPAPMEKLHGQLAFMLHHSAFFAADNRIHSTYFKQKSIYCRVLDSEPNL